MIKTIEELELKSSVATEIFIVLLICVLLVFKTTNMVNKSSIFLSLYALGILGIVQVSFTWRIKNKGVKILTPEKLQLKNKLLLSLRIMLIIAFIILSLYKVVDLIFLIGTLIIANELNLRQFKQDNKEISEEKLSKLYLYRTISIFLLIAAITLKNLYFNINNIISYIFLILMVFFNSYIQKYKAKTVSK